jgi:hypothetical protein
MNRWQNTRGLRRTGWRSTPSPSHMAVTDNEEAANVPVSALTRFERSIRAAATWGSKPHQVPRRRGPEP